MAAVAKSYCDALFSIALEDKKLDEYKEQLCYVEECFKQHKEFMDLLVHPKIKKEDKKEMLETVFKENLDKTLLNFLKLLIDKARFMQLTAIIHEYNKAYNEELNIQVVYVKSAVELEEASKKDLEQKLKQQLNKNIECVYRIDKDLIAGIRIKINDKIYDNSAQARLKRLRKEVELSDIM